MAPGGAEYWVNGKPYKSMTDAEELGRPIGGMDHCADATDVRPELYEIESDKDSYGD